ncbi:MAG: hypothetical protein FJ304_17885 [Planctomycetes bacterium]|nr:hypothetical protein [Planctomycetota bacterium]
MRTTLRGGTLWPHGRFAFPEAFIWERSDNAGKIEGTRWRSLRGFVKGQDIPAGTLRLEFNRDGSLVYHTPMGEFRGTYTLDPGDVVVWNFTRELGGSRRHQQTCIINGNRLTVKDTDGTTLDFEPQR